MNNGFFYDEQLIIISGTIDIEKHLNWPQNVKNYKLKDIHTMRDKADDILGEQNKYLTVKEKFNCYVETTFSNVPSSTHAIIG